MTTKIALTKALSTERDAITAKASAAHEALTAALDVYNGAVADAYAELKAALLRNGLTEDDYRAAKLAGHV